MRDIGIGMLIAFLIMTLGLDEDNDRLRTRIQQLEMQVAYLQSRPPLQPPKVDLSDLWAAIEKGNQQLESLCLALATIARMTTGATKLAGDTDWCPVTMPKRTGEGRIWRKNGWGVTDEEAAAIRAKFL